MGYNLIYWNHICGLYFLNGSPLEKCDFFLEKRPDWGNTAPADMAGLGSIGLILGTAFM